ncbi:YgaP family membrane protein [Halosimplex amylolyticum]|uniref:YgaP family membrane protein n=1 Tax=Halosimplex amylolyticum TaxID=3396616 RepID=UPI003F544E0C
MESNETLDDRSRLARVVLAAVLALVAIQSFRKGKRTRGVLAGVGAAALGYTVSGESDDLLESIDTGATDVMESIGTETAAEPGELRCASCGEPIVPGERRKPNEDGETVHEACLEATA